MTACRNLFLTPSQLEFETTTNTLELTDQDRLEMCGIGVVASAARTTQLLMNYRPRSVVLVGIAGAYKDRAEIGDVICFDEVAIWGIGAGAEDSLQTLSQMNLNQDEFPEHFVLANGSKSDGKKSKLLLTVCNAAGSTDQANWRRERFPAALAEDMEGYAVAAACRLVNVPLQIVRGISNIAGVRDKAGWKIDQAMKNCLAVVNSQIAGVADG